MMNPRFFAAMALLFMFVGGCKRCYQCEVVNEDGDLLWRYKEVCVTKRDYDAYQNICLDAVADSAELSCNCAETLGGE